MNDDGAKVFVSGRKEESRLTWVAGVFLLVILAMVAGWWFFLRQEAVKPAEMVRTDDRVRVEMEKQLRAGNVDYIEAYLKDAVSKRVRTDTPCTYRCSVIEKELVVIAQCDGILERKHALQAVALTANELGELLSVGTPIVRAEMEFKIIKGSARLVIPMDQTRKLGEERRVNPQPGKERLAAYAKAMDWTSFDALYGSAPEVVNYPKLEMKK